MMEFEAEGGDTDGTPRERFTWVSGRMIECTVMGSMSGKMVICMMGNGSAISEMAMASTCGRMAICMRESGNQTSDMATAHKRALVMCIRANGSQAPCTDTEDTAC